MKTARLREEAPDESGSFEEEPVRSRERALEKAGRRARTKAKFVREVLEYALVVGALSIFLPPVAWIVGVIWGIGLVGDLVKKVIEPELRERWVRREVERELRRAVPDQRRALQGDHSRRLEELSAEVAHEIRNPITAAKSLVQQMGEDPASQENVDYARIALGELDRVEKSISHLLKFAREEDLLLADIRLADVVASGVAALDDRIQKDGVLVVTRCDGPLPLRGDPGQLRRVVINLVSNAIDAALANPDAEPRVDVEAGANLAGSEVWLRVRDSGTGIDPEQLERIWSPFFTTKEDGTGLGLAVAKKVIDAHDGHVEVRSERGAGSDFLVVLPRRREAPSGSGGGGVGVGGEGTDGSEALR